VQRGLWLAGAGLLLGLAGALGASRWLGSMMFDVSPRDPLTFGVTVGLVAVMALIATYIPARRASRVDPLIALRAD
jgi:putative ABC transport system permease protein